MSKISLDRVVEVFVEVADTLVDDFDLIEFLQIVASRVVDLLDVAAAGVLLADQRGRLQFMAASDERTRLLELFQVQVEDGPCLDAFRTGAAVINADLSQAGDRWPVFAGRAVVAGYRSVHAVPLRHQGQVIGALNLFGEQPGLLSPDDVRVVQALADMTTIGLLQERAVRRGAQLAEQLQSALNSRVVIEQAKGALSRVPGVDVDAAFELMRGYARRTGRRLMDVAVAVVSDPDDVADLMASG